MHPSSIIQGALKPAELPTPIAELDLTQVIRKLSDNPEGLDWVDEQVKLAVLWYRRFLTIILEHPDFSVVPNGPIDEVWHTHILDTHAYAADCRRVFGQYVHHYPYFGMNGDAADRDAAFDETNRLYNERFGEDCTVMHALFDSHGASTGRKCNDSGSGTGCAQRCGSKS
jgi:hypothetical protein